MSDSFRPTIVVDWDGTCVPHAYPDKPREWLSGAKEALLAFVEAGYDVQIHSCRTHSKAWPGQEGAQPGTDQNPDREDSIAYIRGMLDEAGLEEVGIIADDKPPAIVYIDDRAIRFDSNWDDIRETFVLAAELAGAKP